MLSSEMFTPLFIGYSLGISVINIVYNITIEKMITQNQEKKMLIESMKKLTSHVSGNPQRQKEIFEALSLQDFNKIIANLKDQNEYLRRISALLLCELFYRNDQTKAGLVSLLGIQPKWGRICLGGIPETIFKYPSTLKSSVGQHSRDIDEEDKICWLINLERKTLKIEFLDYKKYSSFTFIDPVKNIFGLTIRNPNAKRQQKSDRYGEINSKGVAQGQNSSKRVTEEQKQKNNTNMQYYKQYIQERQKRESVGYGKKAINLTIDFPESKRASIGGSSPQYRNQLSNSINMKKDLNVSLEIKPVNSDAKYKIENNRSSKPAYQMSPKVSIGNAEQIWNNQYNHNNSYQQEISTERINSSRFGNGGNPNSTRQSASESHERFYKRVKDVLKK